MRRTVFMFAGQGSQYYQMGRDLFEHVPVFRKHLLALDELAFGYLNCSLVELLFHSKNLRSMAFDRTVLTHPAIHIIQCALARTLCDAGVLPDHAIGASLGSVAAAVEAGCITSEQAVRFVVEQAQVFDLHCDLGSMLAILADARMYECTPWLRENAQLAAVNFPNHFVISGDNQRLEDIERRLERESIACQRLAVTRAFHCSQLDSAEHEYRKVAENLQLSRPRIGLTMCEQPRPVDGVTVDRLWRNLRSPIRFRDVIEELEGDGPCRYIDVSPSSTLATFTKYNLRSESLSEIFPIMSPYGRDVQNLNRTHAQDTLH